MEKVRQANEWLIDLFESLGFFENCIIVSIMWMFSHINICTGVAAFTVVMFQLKVVYYKGKREKLKYKKLNGDE